MSQDHINSDPGHTRSKQQLDKAKQVHSKSCREGEKEQEVGDDLSVSVLNISLKSAAYVTSCDLTLVTWSKGHVWEPLTLS